jgi:hypothetical protein
MPGRIALVDLDQAPTVKCLLGIAARNFKIAQRARNEEERTEAALVCVVFMAAAAESAINLFHALTIATIQDRQIRRLYGAVLTEHSRMNLPGKLKLLREASIFVRHNDVLLAAQELFSLRNEILHVQAKYKEHERAFTISAEISDPPGAAKLATYLSAMEKFLRLLNKQSPREDMVVRTKRKNIA